MRTRSEDIHVWPALTDLMGGITLIVVVMLVQSMVIMDLDHADLEKTISELRDTVRRESQRVGVKRELLEALRRRLLANHLSADISPAGNLVVPADVLFAFGKDTIDERKVEPLGRALGELLRSEKGANVRQVLVIGHTDSIGDPDSNLELSAKRALHLVSTWTRQLSDHALPGSACATRKLVPSGMGQQSPAVTGPGRCGNQPGDLGCRANRRIEIEIVPKEAEDGDPCKR